tara:strand:+ start:379 stop:597 length:219 start_codon:yes stop_codon:yes gene_type:complete
MTEYNELNIYDVNCDNINDLLNMKQNSMKEVVPVNIVNDEKYRQLRSIIIQQKSIIKKQSEQIKVLKISIDQ